MLDLTAIAWRATRILVFAILAIAFLGQIAGENTRRETAARQAAGLDLQETRR